MENQAVMYIGTRMFKGQVVPAIFTNFGGDWLEDSFFPDEDLNQLGARVAYLKSSGYELVLGK